MLLNCKFFVKQILYLKIVRIIVFLHYFIGLYAWGKY